MKPDLSEIKPLAIHSMAVQCGHAWSSLEVGVSTAHTAGGRGRGEERDTEIQMCFHPPLTCGNFFLHLARGTGRNRCEHGLHFCSHSLGLLPSNLPFWQLIKDINTYIWNLEEWYRWAYVQGSKGDTDVKNRLFNLVEEGKGGMIWENSIETYTLPCVK